MLVIATFENSIFIEIAISALVEKGIARDKIFAAPLDKRKEQRQLFDTIHRSDGYGMFDLAAILATCFMLLGAIYGFVLAWGPIIWGIFGAVFGLLLGFIIKFLIIKKSRRSTKNITSEIVLLVRCEDNKIETVEKILWEHHALGLTKV